MNASSSAQIVRSGSLLVHLDCPLVALNNVAIDLKNMEHRLMRLLAQNKGKMVTWDMFVSALYTSQGRKEPEMSAYKVSISKLRNALKPVLLAGEYPQDYIRTGKIGTTSYMLVDRPVKAQSPQ